MLLGSPEKTIPRAGWSTVSHAPGKSSDKAEKCPLGWAITEFFNTGSFSEERWGPEVVVGDS